MGQTAYAGGFVSGFVDYVRLGGNGEPPPVPPREYWDIGIRAGNGKEMAGQWFDGFRHGARVAMDGGYRELATLQSSLTAGAHDGPLLEPEMHGAPHPIGSEAAAPVEDLPLPGDGATPFQDDSPAAAPNENAEPGPQINGPQSAPESQPAKTDGLQKSTALPQASARDVDSLDVLQIEELALQAKNAARQSHGDSRAGVSGNPMPGAVIKLHGRSSRNDVEPAPNPAATRPVIRIVSAGQDQEADSSIK